MNVSGTLTNLSAGTLTGGTYEVLGTMDLPGASVTTLGNGVTATTVLLDGAGSTFTDLNSLQTLNSGANFTIQNGRNFTQAATFNNAGIVTAGTGSTLTLSGGGTHSGT